MPDVMRKIFAIIPMAAVLIVASCTKENRSETEYTVSFTATMADDETKSYLDPSTFQVKFLKDEKIMTAAIPTATPSGYKASTIKVTSADGVEPVTLGNGTYSLADKNVELYFFAGTYLKSGVPSPSKFASSGYTEYKTYINQKITAKGPVGVDTDIAGMPLIDLFAVTETFPSLPSAVNFNFHHVAAYGNLKIKNLALAEEDQVKMVTISNAASKYFARRLYAKVDGTVTDATTNANIDKGTTLNLDVTDMNITTSDFNVVFVTAPVDLSQITCTITVTTVNNQTFTQDVTAPKGKGNFQRGHLLPFTVDMTGVVAN